jgi:hypothetical protein
MAKSRKMKHRSRSKKGGDYDSESEMQMESGMGSMGSMGTMGGKRKHKTRGRGRRGGDGATGWIPLNFGPTTDFQYMNTFGNSGNGNSGALIPTVTGAPAVGPNNIPQGTINPNRLVPQFGGKRRRKKGGYWAQVLETALVPFGLLGLQNAYAKRTRKHRK